MAKGKNQQRGLGRGLSALMADVAPAQSAATPAVRDQLIPIEKIHPNPDQPRRVFVQSELEELAASIREKGIIQPLILRAHGPEGQYQIVAGERRWRASQLAQLHSLPAVIREFSDQEVLEIAIIENIQREDLNPLDEALGYRQLMDRFGHTQEKMAEALGKSRSHIANSLRLLNLPAEVQSFLQEGKLSAGHARALVTSENAAEIARQVIARGLSVRETEKLMKKGATATKATSPKPSKDADTAALEDDLSAALRMKVSVNHAAGADCGVVSIRYKSLDQLDDLCRLLSQG